jgi:uncharacterized protein YegL
MGLNDFVASEPRALPIFILADTSGSMEGEKISELNLALREMLSSFKNTEGIRGKFQLSVIAFGGGVNVVQPLADMDTVSLTELLANGNTPMGEALSVLCNQIEDRNIVSSRAYAPVIVLISDGQPTDGPDNSDYRNWGPLRKLHEGERSAKCLRFAMGIGADADTEMLKAFIKNPERPVYKSKDASGISKFFRWVTMTTVARMNSMNPNDISIVSPIPASDDIEEIII